MNVSTELRKLPFLKVSGYCTARVTEETCSVLNAIIRRSYLEIVRRAPTARWNSLQIVGSTGWALMSPESYRSFLGSNVADKLRVNRSVAQACDLPQIISYSDSGLIIMTSSLFNDGALVGSGQPIILTMPEKLKKLSDTDQIGVSFDDTVKLKLYG